MASALFYQACREKDVLKSVGSSVLNINAEAAGLKSPVPGNYNVSLYIENRDTLTEEFDGYIFGFKSNGILTAAVDSAIYKGKWESKNNGTRLKLDIK